MAAEPTKYVLPTLPTEAQANAANDEWGFNCGPGALCAVLGVSTDDVRKLLGPTWPGYSNPTVMRKALQKQGISFTEVYRGDVPVDIGTVPRVPYPAMGLTRIQWSGTWCNPEVPMAARYRQTHWIAETDEMVYDVNATFFGMGWMTREYWSTQLVPWLLKNAVKRADGKWWPTNVWRIG